MSNTQTIKMTKSELTSQVDKLINDNPQKWGWLNIKLGDHILNTVVPQEPLTLGWLNDPVKRQEFQKMLDEDKIGNDLLSIIQHYLFEKVNDTQPLKEDIIFVYSKCASFDSKQQLPSFEHLLLNFQHLAQFYEMMGDLLGVVGI